VCLVWGWVADQGNEQLLQISSKILIVIIITMVIPINGQTPAALCKTLLRLYKADVIIFEIWSYCKNHRINMMGDIISPC
jgi:hypothetical protein